MTENRETDSELVIKDGFFNEATMQKVSAMSAVLFIDLLLLTQKAGFIVPSDPRFLSAMTGKSEKICKRFIEEAVTYELGFLKTGDLLILKPEKYADWGARHD